MLPSQHRLRKSADFSAVLRGGRRTARPTVVVHLLLPPPASPESDRPARVGFVVGRAVGNSVVRHRVSRRLRAVLAAELDRLPDGSDLVVRALPPVTRTGAPDLRRDVERAVSRLLGAVGSTGSAGGFVVPEGVGRGRRP